MSEKQKFNTLQKLFAVPERWTQGAFARSADGAKVPNITEDSAVCWCLLGGVGKVYGDGPAYASVLRALRDALSDTALSRWNDSHGRTHKDILDLVTKARV